MRKKLIFTCILITGFVSACTKAQAGTPNVALASKKTISTAKEPKVNVKNDIKIKSETKPSESKAPETNPSETTATTKESDAQSKEAKVDEKMADGSKVALNPDWKYSSFAKINSGEAVFYRAKDNVKNITIAVNAGHGTKGGERIKTLVHPDGSAKFTGGTTKAGAKEALAVSSGMTFLDGTSEASANLKMANKLKEVLLARGFDVLMIRDGEDVQLDNIARTVIANNMAKAHVAVHFDSTSSNKGAYYMAVADNAAYKEMEPVASNWQNINALGDSIIGGLKARKVKIFGKGSMGMDLTQTSYSTIPSVVVELGDKSTDYKSALESMANGIADGVESYFKTK